MLGFVLAFFVGVTLGLLGGGGSILTLPILVYFMGVEPSKATAYSLFIVGVSALIATQRFYVKKLIDFKVGLFFAIPSFVGVYIVRKWVVPIIPDPFFSIVNLEVSKDLFLLLFFAIIMLGSGFSMLFSKRKNKSFRKKINYYLILVDGLFVGAITGLVGAGGGFLIVPALVLLAGLDIKKAIGTSLLIISFKSLLGFTGDLGSEMDWNLLLVFTSISCIGIYFGIYISKFIKPKSIKKYFGVFVVLIAFVIILKEVLW
ncbi:MAG: sulfite exporter TauE/SafE family protein [Flavobacteriales bacterium]